MFLVYQSGTSFIKVNEKNLKLSLTKDINKASVWTNQKEAKTWSTAIKHKYNDAELKEAILTLK